jgi:hypothetical protein
MINGVSDRHLDIAYVMLGLLGGLTLYVVGQFYKVVPFLAWMSRFHDDMGKRRVPTVAQLYSSRIAHINLALFVLGIIAMEIGVITGISKMARAGGCLFTGGVLLFVSQIIRVAFGTSFGGFTQASPSISTTSAKALG